eukprot:220914-Alexandrium_andersonii.AAC.1
MTSPWASGSRPAGRSRPRPSAAERVARKSASRRWWPFVGVGVGHPSPGAPLHPSHSCRSSVRER